MRLAVAALLIPALLAACSDERPIERSKSVASTAVALAATEALVPCRADDAPSIKLATLLGAMDGTKSVPAMLEQLAAGPSPLIPAGTFAGGVVSPSLQQSQGLADPRVLLYTPCVITVMTIYREIGARWMWFSIAYQTALAWLVSFAAYQLGGLMGFA